MNPKINHTTFTYTSIRYQSRYGNVFLPLQIKNANAKQIQTMRNRNNVRMYYIIQKKYKGEHSNQMLECSTTISIEKIKEKSRWVEKITFVAKNYESRAFEQYIQSGTSYKSSWELQQMFWQRVIVTWSEFVENISWNDCGKIKCDEYGLTVSS